MNINYKSNYNKIKRKVKLKNKILFVSSLLFASLVILSIYTYDSYFANWYIDNIPYENRTIFHLFIDAWMVFVPSILCIVLMLYLLNRTIICNSFDEVYTESKNKALKGIQIPFSVEELKKNIMDKGYLYDENSNLYYCVFENGFFKKKLFSIVAISKTISESEINEILQSAEKIRENASFRCDLAIGILAHGDYSFGKIQEFVFSFSDDKKCVMNPVFIDFSKKKAHLFVVYDLFSKTFCLHSQTVEYLVSNID